MRMDLGVVGLAGCFSDWILTRPWGRILLCFLPLFIAFSTVGLVTAGSWLSRDKLATRYLALADKEVEVWEKQWAPAADAPADDTTEPEAAKSKTIPPSAEMLFRRVQQLQQNDSRSIFFVAMCYIQRGATQQGLTMLNRIAPADRVGYLPAHAYLVEQMLARPMPAGDVPIARHHAEAALRWDRISPQLLWMISDLFRNLREPDRALSAMRQAAGRDPKYYLLLAQLARGEKKYAKVYEEALEKASLHFQERLSENPQDMGARLMLADAQRIQGDFAAAEQTVVDGMKLSDSPILKTALSEIYCQLFAKTASFTTTSWTGDLDLLEKAHHLDPNNLRVFDEVAKLARVAGAVPNELLMTQLRNNLAEGKATSVTHMWIAEHYLNTNQFAKAVPHLEQAVKRDPLAAHCWNNLAYCIADLDKTRLEEALQAADRAVAIDPRVPDYHDTRGTILMKMNRAGDAVTSFERAIEMVTKSGGRFRPQPDYHERLSEAYVAAGDQAMAETHKQFAVTLTESIAKAAEARKTQSSPATTPTEPAPTEPAPTEPATTEPATTEPATTEPATTEPAPTEPVPSDPRPTEPAPETPADAPAKSSDDSNADSSDSGEPKSEVESGQPKSQ